MSIAWKRVIVCALALGAWIGPAAAAPIVVDAALLSQGSQDPDAEIAKLDAINDRDIVLLNLSIPVPAAGSIDYLSRAGEPVALSECGFEELADMAEIGVTPYNHLLLTIRLGDPSRHAANAAYCEYGFARATDDVDQGLRGAVTVRGCFLANAFSIPTARHLILNPLPASACGLHR